MRMLITEDSPIISEVSSGRSSYFGCGRILGPGGYFATRKAVSWRETSMISCRSVRAIQSSLKAFVRSMKSK